MNYKLTSTNVLIALIILGSMSLVCHINSLIHYILNKKNGKVVIKGEKFSDKCDKELVDPCPDVLENHPKIPDDVKVSCKKGYSEVKGVVYGEDNVDVISNEEYDKLLMEYAVRTAKRLPVYPWYEG